MWGQIHCNLSHTPAPQHVRLKRNFHALQSSQVHRNQLWISSTFPIPFFISLCRGANYSLQWHPKTSCFLLHTHFPSAAELLQTAAGAVAALHPWATRLHKRCVAPYLTSLGYSLQLLSYVLSRCRGDLKFPACIYICMYVNIYIYIPLVCWSAPSTTALMGSVTLFSFILYMLWDNFPPQWDTEDKPSVQSTVLFPFTCAQCARRWGNAVCSHSKDSRFHLRQSGWSRAYGNLLKSRSSVLSSSQHKQSLSSPPPNLKQFLPSDFQEIPCPSAVLSGEPQFWHVCVWAQLADVFPSHAFRRSKVYPKMYSLLLAQGKNWKLSDLRTAAGSAKTAKTAESTRLISGTYLLKSC